MGNLKTVLIVMNNASEVWATAQDLTRKGLSVTASASGKDGLMQMERREFDYLIIDGAIQEVSLLTFLANCRRYFPETGTIVITDPNTEIKPATVQLAGAKYCVSRPDYRDVLSDIIFGLDAGKSSMETIQ